MSLLTPTPLRVTWLVLVSFHLFIIALSNYLVQIPVEIFSVHTTWGAITFPFIFLATDLTVRIFGSSLARKIIYTAMLPALLISYLFSVIQTGGLAALGQFDSFVARIAFASFLAYTFGQLLDVYVFSRLRSLPQWWIAPTASNVIGGFLDTVIFFSVAFYQSSDAFMAANWPEIASVDYAIKVVVNLLLFIPVYGVVMANFAQRITIKPTTV
ncbi:7-cyano-7-deazaguanine/7-aminomethyl-7-deazaguanine transporter [uncultured Thiothrix sp.]|uniref:7-cyano-7-deazaguanine/7-aminomethyl-7- deazaguanine transporter n=1 Tax=uncultured Thiothrix sp. TaxID=223185 RepID=UPI0026079119|nr:7-cyano-7-deazaguanine/7-aminomethyl-7-deazaguanine transporter [uncultured Thiothrix sp.]